MKRKVALAALTCIELAPPELVSTAAAAGYDGVGLRLIPVAGQTLPPLDLRALQARLADSAIAVLDVEVFRLSAETRIADFEPTLAIAGRLRASEILVHGADPDEARLVERFAELCDLAARYGLAANLEPMPWVNVSTVAQAKRIIERAAEPNGAVLIDAIHFYRADNRLDELRGAPVRYMQLCDAHPGRPSDIQELIRQARSDRLFPGEGALDLKALMRALPDGLPISIETPIARRLDPLERARLALQATQRFLA